MNHNLLKYLFIDNVSLKKDPNPPTLSVYAGNDIYLINSCSSSQIEPEILNPACDMSYSWSPTTGLSAPTILNPIASPSTTTTYTITVTDVASGATATDQITVFVNESEIPNNGPIELTCFDDPINLTTNLNATGGIFYLGADPIENMFDPSQYGIGDYEITYVIGEGDCVAYSNFTITVNPLIVENYGNLNIECDANPIDLYSNVSHPGGNFDSDLPLNDGILDPSLAGFGTFYAIYYLYQDNCYSFTSFTITISPLALINYGDVVLDCEDEVYDLNPNVSVPGGTFTLNGIDIPNGLINPIELSSGVYEINYEFPVGSCYGSTQFTLSIDPVIVSNFGDITTCFEEGIIDLNQNISVSGGLFYYGTQNIIDGLFNPADYGEGSYIISYTIGTTACAVTTTFTVTISGTANATHPNGLSVINGSSNDGATLTGSFQFLDDLIIQNGAVFTFSNAEVQFAEGKGIFIEPGGRLDINNSKLSNLTCEGANWLGIRTGGNPVYSQYGTDVSNQGRCYIKYSTIENAIIGITNYGMNMQRGGIIKTIYATFKNCRQAVHHRSYNNYHPSGNLDVSSKFYNSEFLWDEEFQFINDINNPMIDLMGVKGVLFSGCDFINTHPDLFSFPNNSFQKAAILCRSKASVNIKQGCNGEPPYLMTPYGCENGNKSSNIRGFNYGIVLRFGADPSSIQQTNFNCYRGFWATDEKSLRLTQNKFGELPPNLLGLTGSTDPNDPAWGVTYGAYLDYSTLYWVEGNSFNFPNTSICAGLLIKSSGGAYNKIYDNKFHNVTYGILAYDDNRGLNNFSGLKLSCNWFNNKKYNILVYPTTATYPNGWGISHWQGMANIYPYFSGQSAGNYFTNNTYYNVFNVLENVIYYYHSSENLMTTIGVTTVPLTDANPCPSSFPSPYFPGIQAEMMQHKVSADSIANVLALIVDDGSTQQLTTEVILANYAQAVELYYDLMQISPNLSEEVMIEAINKETELPAALLTLILKSNPHAAKSGKLQKELDERSQPLAEYQRAMINEGLELVSYKEGLEAGRAYHENRYNTLLNRLIIETLADTTVLNKIEAIESLITDYETVDHFYLIIDLHISNGNINAAQEKLNKIATVFNLDPRRDAEYADFLSVYSILFNKLNTGSTTLTSSEYNQLMMIAYRHSTLAAGKALILLEQYADQPFLEVLVPPIIHGKSNDLNFGDVKTPKIINCKVYPNPTLGILMVEIPSDFESIKAQLTDATGRVVFEQEEVSGLATLNLRHLASGIYTLHLQSENGELQESHKIQISK